MNTLYTAGYLAGWTPVMLLAEAERLDAVVLDIRMNPTSMRPEWHRRNLALFLRNRYRHCADLGNRNYQGGGAIEIANPNEGLYLLRILLSSQSVILLCGCSNHLTCHRTVVAAMAQQRLGYTADHLIPPTRPIDDGSLYALTVRQPWASAIFLGKDIENRTWPTRVRGRVAIHAAKGMTRADYCDAALFAEEHGRDDAILDKADLVRGAVLGTVELVDCVTESESPWFDGSGYGFVLCNPILFDSPIPATGALGFWQWTYPREVALERRLNRQ